MKLKVAILGAGAMGSAISIPLIDSRNYVNLWGTEYDVQILNSIVQNRFHPSLKTVIPEEVNVFYPQDLDKALEECDTVFIAVSSEAVNSIIKRALPYMKTVTKLVILSKGLYEDGDNVSLLSTMIEEIVRQTRKEVEEMRIVSVGGPCIAEELANKVPTAVLYASKYLGDADECKKNFETAYYRIHTTSDVIGVEVCAALKNVYSIAVGWCHGLSEAFRFKSMFNLESLIITQSVKEMSVITQRLGGRFETAFGLAGMGDLYVTVRKIGGRNLLFGSLLGKGMSVKEAVEYLNKKGIQTIEGISTALKVHALLTKGKSNSSILEEVPLLSLIIDVIQGKIQVKEAINILTEMPCGLILRRGNLSLPP